MKALPPLTRVQRYGSVRQTSDELIKDIISTLLIQVNVHLVEACCNIKDDLAMELTALIVQTQTIVTTLQATSHREAWQENLQVLSAKEEVHGLIAGKSFRLLQNQRLLSPEDSTAKLEQVLSQADAARHDFEALKRVAFWIEGFFSGSALTLIHDDALWRILDSWILGIQDEAFLGILPLLRRTFSGFSDNSRQQLQDKARQHLSANLLPEPNFSHEQARQVLPLLAQLLGVEELHFSEGAI